MLRGQNLSLRIMNSEEVVPYSLYLNDPQGSDKDAFIFTSPIKLMETHIQSSYLTEEEAVLAIDVGEAKHVGYASWYFANPAVGNLELDIKFYNPEHDSEVHRREIMILVGKYLFDNRPMERLQILLRPEDEIGRKAAWRTGFVQEGTLKQMVFVRGEWCDLEIWSLLREEFNHA